MSGIGSRTDTITSVCAPQLDERMSAWQRDPRDPTDTHRTAREEIGHDVGAGGTAAPADAAFLPVFFSFRLPFPLSS